MWSDRYNYYNIQYDRHFSQKLDTVTVTACLSATNFFEQTGPQTFTNKSNFPWATIVLANTADGSFKTSDQEDLFVTLIAIVCAKGADTEQEKYIQVFKQVADRLNWKLYLEEDDHGNENIEL